MAKVTLDGVWKIYDGKVTAVRDINLEINDGEFVVLVGPSGCGKSTTLRMVAGLEEISRGFIRIGDRVVNDIPPKNRDIAMVFQNYALYPHMSVRDNLAFGLKLRRVAREEIDKRVNEAARILGIVDLLERRPKALSGGQRQRVAMGRAIVRNPAVFLFDEPLSNLDAKMRVEMRKEIMHLHKTIKTTMVYVTHDQVEAMTLGDRIVVMSQGLVQQAAEPLTVYRYPANTFVASFIGTPPMNLFDGSLENRDGKLTFVNQTMSLPLSAEHAKRLADYVGKPVIFGIRPEDMYLKELRPEGTDPVIEAETQLSETLGNEILGYLKSGPSEFRVRFDPRHRFEQDVKVQVCPVMDHAHVFEGINRNSTDFDESVGRFAAGAGRNLTVPEGVEIGIPQMPAMA